jgi:hypothetical protein
LESAERIRANNYDRNRIKSVDKKNNYQCNSDLMKCPEISKEK